MPNASIPHSKMSTNSTDCFSQPVSLPLTRHPLWEWESRLGDDWSWASPDCAGDGWAQVQVPHNWEDYHGYPSVSHGNLHGTAWYRTWIDFCPGDERLYAFFEGVGSYATVFCNGVPVGEHAGGRTTFTVDLTPALRDGRNLLAVRAHHPEKIDDLPFICGGCWGSPNTEGSQPFGIFRPAWIERTGPIRAEPFGLHVFTPVLERGSAVIETRLELRNAGNEDHRVDLRLEIFDPGNEKVFTRAIKVSMRGGEIRMLHQKFPPLSSPRLWSPENPELYRAMVTITASGRLSHTISTTFGMRWLEWPDIAEPLRKRPGAPRENEGPNPLRQPVCADSAPAQIAPRGAIVSLSGGCLPDSAELSVEMGFVAGTPCRVRLLCEIQNENGTVFFHQNRTLLNLPEESAYRWKVPTIYRPKLWREDDPYLHKLIVELRSEEGDLWERGETYFGIRQTHESLNLAPVRLRGVPSGKQIKEIPSGNKILRLNGQPHFLRGTCEYETLLGCDHAFSDEQISANVAMIRTAGFNAFRDAHHPHNLRYYDHWDRAGIVCWTQMGSHVWFDSPGFRENYRRLVSEWVKERRNHPSVVLWGLQNESSLPEDFAVELRDLIRELDPTSPKWRPTTTCNGGRGSDWNVPQEWSGTYGGNCNDYDLELLQMVGEFGAWREFGVHTEHEYLGDENDRSETWACHAMETKIRLGEAVHDRAVGHFHWAFNSFPNPGRTADNHEGPGNAGIGSVNNKGLLTAWGQPSDLYYLFRANYSDPGREPMVYIVSHTWPDRWKTPGTRKVRVYSNCDEVELFDGIAGRSLGVRRQPGRGNHFVWEGVHPRTNVLRAKGRSGSRCVEDVIVLDFLPLDPALEAWTRLAPSAGREDVVFRVACGSDQELPARVGPSWRPDQPWNQEADFGWSSWGNRFPNVTDDIASRGFSMTPVRGAAAAGLGRTYRYGRHELSYRFRIDPGTYRLRLHFAEPWFGVGSGLDCRGWRLFDIAINGNTVERKLDIWAEAGGDHRALVREYDVKMNRDLLILHFPKVQVNQAVICGIEVLKCIAGGTP